MACVLYTQEAAIIAILLMITLSLVRFIVVCAWAIGLHLEAHALTWRTTAVRATARPGEKITVQFPFENISDKPVRITSVATSCDCTTVKLARETYATGEKGMIQAEFDAGWRRGRQQKTIVVVADDAPGSPTTLTLVVDMEEAATMEPRLVLWRVAQPAAAKRIILRTPGASKPAIIKTISAGDPRIRWEVEASEGADFVAIVLTPTDTGTTLETKVKVEFITNGSEQTHEVTAAIK